MTYHLKVGSFEVPADSDLKTLDCLESGTRDSVTHSTNTDKTEVTFTFIAPVFSFDTIRLR